MSPPASPRIVSGWRRFAPLAVLVVVGFAIWVVQRELAQVHPRDVWRALDDIGARHLGWAVALTAVSYLLLTGYDTLALRHLGRPLAYRRTALAAFVGYVFNMTVGFSVVGSSAVRLRMYSRWGLSGGEIAGIVGFCALTSGLGLCAAAGTVFLIGHPPARVETWISTGSLRGLGALLVALTIAYIVACACVRRTWRVRRWQVRLPSLRVAIGQLCLATLDLAAAGGVLYVLLPQGDVPFTTFFGIYLFAVAAVAVSHVPGGLGVLESVVLVGLPTQASPASLFATLVAFRCIYYFGPFLLGLTLLGAHEWRCRRTPRFAFASPPPPAQG